HGPGVVVVHPARAPDRGAGLVGAFLAKSGPARSAIPGGSDGEPTAVHRIARRGQGAVGGARQAERRRNLAREEGVQPRARHGLEDGSEDDEADVAVAAVAPRRAFEGDAERGGDDLLATPGGGKEGAPRRQARAVGEEVADRGLAAARFREE